MSERAHFSEWCLLSYHKENSIPSSGLVVLLYVSETWALKAEQIRCLSSFHNRCIRCDKVPGVGRGAVIRGLFSGFWHAVVNP